MAFTLAYGTATLILPNPLPEDSRTYDFGTVVRSTRGGDLKVFKPTARPELITRAYNFNIWSETDIIGLKNFFLDHTGEEVEIQDYSDAGVSTGLIITQEPEIITPRDNCWWQLGFEYIEKSFTYNRLLQENGDALLQESGSYILL